jgi:hypothetical protein
VFLYKRILVGDQERVLLISNGRLQQILVPGQYRVWTLGRDIEMERHNVRELEFTSDWAEHIFAYRSDLVERFFTAVETRDTESALVYLNGKLARVVGPGRRVFYWADVAPVTSRVFDAKIDPEVPRDAVPSLARMLGSAQWTDGTPVIGSIIDEGTVGLLFVDGRFIRTLGPGPSAFWTTAGVPRVEVVDLRAQIIEVVTDGVLTMDKVLLRISLSASFQVIDPVLAKTAVQDYAGYLHRVLELVTRHSIAKRTFAEVLAEKSGVISPVLAEVSRRMMAYGVRVSAVAIHDIVGPDAMPDTLSHATTAC